MSGSQVAGAQEQQEEKTPLRSRIGLWLGGLSFIFILLFVDLDPSNPLVTRMFAVVVLMAIWWMTEAIPIPATSLLPLVLFPVLGIMRGRVRDASSQVDLANGALPPGMEAGDLDIVFPNVASQYMDWLIFLFLGGFLIAIAVEKWNLHRRIALHILRLIGGQPHRLVLGFMVATGFLSMWLSNTATTMMMMPMALSLIVLYEDLNKGIRAKGGEVDTRAPNFALVLMLGIAYSASIGGLATIIGTPPNGVFVTQLAQLFPDAPAVSFAGWMVFALPLSIIFMFISWFLLSRVLYPLPSSTPFSGRDFINKEISSLGRMGNEEKKVAIVFAAVAILWMTRSERLLGPEVDLYGWSHWLDLLLSKFGIAPVGAYIDDGTVSIGVALTLFMIPASKEQGGFLLDWDSAKKVPWGILLLFGGGLAMAKGFAVSGLSAYLADLFEQMLDGASPLLIVMSVVTFITGFTEFTSNTATSSMSMPIMASLAQAIDVSPMLLMIPAAIAASCAFMLPVSTPPNAIVYGSGKVPITKMVKAGLILDLVSVFLVTLLVYTLGHLSFDVLGGLPDWALRQ
ncbi:MAG: SLC13 family permease [Pseudohongiellaceae bacterium]|nr:SLC13 family permease [Pseudohongiellaceae bacterium]